MALDELRAALAAVQDWQGAAEELASIENRVIPGTDGPIPVPHLPRPRRPSGPLVLFTFGGGFVTGSLDHVDRAARLLARATGGVLVSVGYRLAPEHPFPAGLEDAYAALAWAAGEGAAELGADPSFVAVAGDSSGGNFAAALTLLARDRGGPSIAHQLLVYPVLDHDFTTSSYELYADSYFLTRPGHGAVLGQLRADEKERAGQPGRLAAPGCRPHWPARRLDLRLRAGPRSAPRARRTPAASPPPACLCRSRGS
ncbi:MAG: alpha/beta hydrolase fold domain-containing protein [Hymenobacter sp.]